MNPFAKIINPRLPSAAIGLSGEGAGVVSLDRRRDLFTVKRAGYVALPDRLVRPHFDETNIADANELAEILAELVTSTGLVKQHRWSVALPESATRTTILTTESATASGTELEEVLRWKIERSIAVPLDELRVSRERISPDAQGRARYLVAAVRLAVLNEYESVFESLGWRAGLILPRHMGEAWWLMTDRTVATDSLLVSAHRDGFTAVLLRSAQPLVVRGVLCEPGDRADELYRFLLFYRDRLASVGGAGESPLETIGRVLIT
ncbi:MAG TPA: pilus assembly protein PilM, partial [Pyrinomonadaceae bacterium]|nr:pilus assembly protein PilM [Pyrinomonadaceae bacterium]